MYSLNSVKLILASLEEKGATIETINISTNKIGNPGASELGVRIAKFPNLKSLDLSSNKIGDRGACKLFECLFDANIMLRDVNLSGNELCSSGDAGAFSTALAKYITKNNAYDIYKTYIIRSQLE